MFIISILKKVYGRGKKEEDKTIDIEELQKVINEILPGVTLFVRDADLPPEIVAQYKVGEIIREKGFTDASCRVGGMVTSHRYAILSNHMGDFRPFEHGTNWGLFVAQHDAHFKVLDVYEYQGKTQITLLHLPDDDRWKMFENVELTIEADLISKCREYLEKSCMKEVISELAAGEWLDRCRLPLGIYDMRVSGGYH